jgi:hypothetical protein
VVPDQLVSEETITLSARKGDSLSIRGQSIVIEKKRDR